MTDSAGKRFRQALAAERPLQIVGTMNAYTAMMAEQTGFNAVYLSGAGVANASYGLPDLGMTSLENVLEDASRITGATQTPLLVDIDTRVPDGELLILSTGSQGEPRSALNRMAEGKHRQVQIRRGDMVIISGCIM